MKLYYHKTDGGRISDRQVCCESDGARKAYFGATFVMRIDGDINMMQKYCLWMANRYEIKIDKRADEKRSKMVDRKVREL